MRALLITMSMLSVASASAQEKLLAKPDAFQTLVNPNCSHCRDEAKRRAGELRDDEPVLCWIRGYSEGGAIPYRFFLNPYRVISDTYGVFVYDPDAGYARGFAPSLEFKFHGWRHGVMLMEHKDGTVYSCLTGRAISGPRRGERLTAVPTLVNTWGHWLKTYPQAVAYHMFDKYQPTELPMVANADSAKTRGPADQRLAAETLVLGVDSGKSQRAYPIEAVAKARLLQDDLDGEPCVVLWHEATKAVAAYRPTASPPKKVKAEPRKLTLSYHGKLDHAPFVDRETGSHWDIAGRAVDGELKDWTLTWLDGVQVKWYAWAAEQPETSIHGVKAEVKKADAAKTMKEVAGTSEYLKLVPKKFGIIEAIDIDRHSVRLRVEGEATSQDWRLASDAEIKIAGWWGRLGQIEPGSRVWAWFGIGRDKKPFEIFMLADALSEQAIHGGVTVQHIEPGKVVVQQKKAKHELTDATYLRANQPAAFDTLKKDGQVFFLKQPTGSLLLDAKTLDHRRDEQKATLRKLWIDEGLPGTVGWTHVYSGELDVLLDHEAIRWGRALKTGDKVKLRFRGASTWDAPIDGMVKAVVPQREKTQVRVVAHSLDLAHSRLGTRVLCKVSPPPSIVDTDVYPPDIDRVRSKEDRIEWFLASIYCTCGVAGDICTGHFFTLASCNPNGCGAPNETRRWIADKIAQGLTDRQIFDALLADRGEAMLRPHLLQ